MVRDDIKLDFCNIPSDRCVELIDEYISSANIFKRSPDELMSCGITRAMADKIVLFNRDQMVDEELQFVERYKIRTLSYGSSDYPPNLSNCIDPPFLLYVKGNIDFMQSPEKWISIVGTRKCSSYGTAMTERLVAQIARKHPDAVIVSGLAYGIDGVAHRAALANGLKTVAVMAHGLSTIYPPEHRDLAKEIIASGGAVISEFSSKVPITKFNFVQRNRIVAAISSSTILIESPLKGGSLITADLADGYDREVFTIPGRATDKSFEGNINLLKNNKANLITSADDIEYNMGWAQKDKSYTKQLSFTTYILSDEEQEIFDLFPDSDEVNVDYFYEQSELAMPKIVAILSKLEFSKLIRRTKGRLYCKINE